MHFLMAEAVVRERETELHRNAGRVRGKRATSRRQRFGWKLVDLGLRLAVSP